jgi:hypothetical protein
MLQGPMLLHSIRSNCFESKGESAEGADFVVNAEAA